MCPSIDKSEFAVPIFKDVATVRDLTPQGTPVNLDKFHYLVTENDISDTINFGFGACFPSGFKQGHGLFYRTVTEDPAVQYQICVNYVGVCEGTKE